MPFTNYSAPFLNMDSINPLQALQRRDLANQASKQNINQKRKMFVEQLRQQQMANDQSQAINPELLHKAQMANEITTKKMPYVTAEEVANIKYKLLMAQWLGSPGAQQKYLTKEGKQYTEPGVIRTIQAQQNANPTPSAQVDATIQRMSGQPNQQPQQGGQNGNNVNQPPQIVTNSPEGLSSGNMSQPGSPAINPQSPQGTPQLQPDVPTQGQVNLTPQQKINDEYNLRRLKSISDPQARQKSLYAMNIEKTLSRMNPDDLLRYSGPQGHFKLALEKAKGMAGHASPEYNKYMQSLNNAHMLAQQVRQFYGTSVRPQALKHLEQMVNPSSWIDNPKTAKAMFSSMSKTLNSELKTYRDAMNLRGTFDKPAKLQGAASAAPQGKVMVVSPDGTRGYLPAKNLDRALQAGYKRG
tara:strand:- start:159 stop:1394 length:1236 start_codon:yes stop_codon:yes gene_type:complete